MRNPVGHHTRPVVRIAAAVALAVASLACSSGPEDWDTLNDAAKQAAVDGREDEARDLFRLALARARSFAPGDARLIRSYNNMAEFLRSTGDLEAAEPFYVSAVEEMENALEPDPEALARSYANLAGVYHRLGKPGRAAAMFGNAADAYARYLPNRPSERAAALHNLGLQAMLLGDTPRAEAALRGALAVWRGETTADHSREALTLVALAQVATGTERFDEAEALYVEAIDLLRRNEGPDAAALADAHQNLALFYRSRDRQDDALREQRETLTIREALAGGEPDAAVAEALNNLALILRAVGRDDEAADLYDRALSNQEEALGPDHRAVAATLHNMARLRADRGEIDEADRLWARAADIADRSMAPDAPTRLTILRAWSRALDAAGRPERAAAARARAGGA